MKIFQFELSVKGETVLCGHNGEDDCTTEQAKAEITKAICEDFKVEEGDVVFVSQEVTER